MLYKLCLIGCGNVGQGLLEILHQKANFLKRMYDFEVKVVAINDKLKGSLILPEGIQLEKILKILKEGKKISDYKEGNLERNKELEALETIERCDAQIVAELTYTDIKTAEPATSHIKKALETGKHVVTSNKGPAALHYRQLSALAKRKGVFFKIEGTVMSGTPVFNLFENCLTGNSIKEIKGILNGTTNFILSKMEEEGMEYLDALKLAQSLGYAEADPSADVEGYDALAKVVILANVLLQGEIKPSEVRREGITSITREEVKKAREEGFRYKLIGSAKRKGTKIEASVTPQKLPLQDPLAQVMGAQNAITFETDLMGKITIHGPGAGKIETGYSILSDMLSIHRALCTK